MDADDSGVIDEHIHFAKSIYRLLHCAFGFLTHGDVGGNREDVGRNLAKTSLGSSQFFGISCGNYYIGATSSEFLGKNESQAARTAGYENRSLPE
jgi:hypothetical protein